MRHNLIRITAAALFLMGQAWGGLVLGSSGETGTAVVTCHMACCEGTVCKCDMTPPAAPMKQTPAAPVHANKDLKSLPVAVALVNLPAANFSLPKPARILSPDLLMPHGLPRLTWLCALLI